MRKRDKTTQSQGKFIIQLASVPGKKSDALISGKIPRSNMVWVTSREKSFFLNATIQELRPEATTLNTYSSPS